MCGILGIINLKNKKEISRNEFSKMLNMMSHRGPDDMGIYIDENIMLGHKRLSILDLSKAGKQPMFSKNRNFIIIHNGEIYNFKEIRQNLKLKNYNFKSNTDTEVILKGYIEYGIKVLDILRGMFAFAIYDKKVNKIYIVRDRLGIKPLYYTEYDGKFIFASEIKSILKYPNFYKKEDYLGISSYLSYRYPIHDLTFFKNVKSLLPGHYITIDLIKKKIILKQYWELPIVFEKPDMGEIFYISKIRELLAESVKYRMISDVPIGAYLSGGLDSSIIVSLMSQFSCSKLNTFTIGFKEKGFNELKYARKVASIYDTEHHELVMTGINYIEEMEKLISYKDAPLGVPNEPALFLMSKELKKYITVVLSGEGADEIFGGYGRIFRSPYDFRRLKELEKINYELRNELVVKLMYDNLKIKYNNKKFKNEIDFFIYLYQYINWNEKKKFFSKDFINFLEKDLILEKIIKKYFFKLDGISIYDKFMWIFEKIHIEGLLQRLDTSTMATSVEARVPFVDHKLIEFVMTIPIKYKLKWKSFLHKLSSIIYNTDQISEEFDIPKYILKKSFEKDLPKEIIWRKKMGFPVPIHIWLGKNFINFSKEIIFSRESKNRGIYNIKEIEKFLNNKEIEKDYKLGFKLWMLINLELWFKKYIDR